MVQAIRALHIGTLLAFLRSSLWTSILISHCDILLVKVDSLTALNEH